jgi:hypothetical protein
LLSASAGGITGDVKAVELVERVEV